MIQIILMKSSSQASISFEYEPQTYDHLPQEHFTLFVGTDIVKCKHLRYVQFFLKTIIFPHKLQLEEC